MKIKLLLKCGAVFVLGLLFITYAAFINRNQESIPVKEGRDEAIYVLAPYEVSLHKQILEEIADNYSKMRGKKQVIIEFISKENYKKEICMRMDKGKTADIIICDSQMMPALIEMGVFRDISDNLSRDTLSKYWPALLSDTRDNGKYYGLPFTVDPYVLYYNEDALSKNGLEAPNTWEEVIDTGEKVKRLGVSGFGFGAKRPEEAASFFMQMLYSMGGSVRALDGSAGIQAFQTLQMLRKQNIISNQTINWSETDLAYAFSDGHVVMMANRLSMISVLRSQRIDFNIGIEEIPGDKKHAYLHHGENIGVTVSAAPQALDFFKYLTREDIVERIAYGMDVLPVQVMIDYREKKIRINNGEEFAQHYKSAMASKETFKGWFDIAYYITEGIYEAMEADHDSVKVIGDEVQDKVRGIIISEK